MNSFVEKPFTEVQNAIAYALGETNDKHLLYIDVDQRNVQENYELIVSKYNAYSRFKIFQQIKIKKMQLGRELFENEVVECV